MICQFCQQETVYVPLQVSEKHTFIVHYCYACQAEYVDHKTDNGLTVSLYTTIGNRLYRWMIMQDDDGPVGHLWHIGEPGIPGQRPNRKVKLLKTFHTPPNIIPSNVEKKLRFILLFL